MINSRDPQRMEAGFTGLDMIWRRNPQVAESVYGKEAVDRMQIWQAKRDAFQPDEIARDFLTVDDPSQKAARERLKTEAEKELVETTAETLVSRFSGGWLSHLPFASGPHLADGTVPATAMFPDRMLADYRTIYTALRQNGLSAEKAAWSATERLRQSWGPSEAAGNVIMKRPPEMVINPQKAEPFYPSLGGSHQWIKDDINSKIEAMLGPQFGPGPAPRGPIVGMTSPGNIDLYSRPRVQNQDGTVSTLRPINLNIDKKEVLIPTIKDDGEILSKEQAIAEFKRTGKHLGVFATAGLAKAYEKQLIAAQTVFHGEKAGPQVVGDSIISQNLGRENWKFVGLVSDTKTEEDIAAGRPPSYSIVVQKPNGMIETVIDPKTGSPRHSFDISLYLAKYETDMRARERRVKENLAISRSFDGVQP